MALHEGPGVTGDQALQRLAEGNKRYVAGRATHPNRAAKRRAEVAKGQQPIAAILGCADSRVPPEVVFDQGLTQARLLEPLAMLWISMAYAYGQGLDIAFKLLRR